MSKVPPPVLGFNNNVRHRGRIFHIQTEDSGVRFPRIVTHLFADGGRIIKTTKTDYTEHLSRQDLAQVVRSLMKEQHKGMFTSLRAGTFDALLEHALGPLSEPPPLPKASGVMQAVPPPPPSPAEAAHVRPTAPEAAPQEAPVAVAAQPSSEQQQPSEGSRRVRALSNPNLQAVRPSVAPPSPDALDRAMGASLDQIPASRGSKASKAPPRNSSPPRSRKSNPAASRKRNSVAPANRAPAVPQRPAAQFAAAPPPSARSIFGDGVGEKSLDEVILSYLAEDLEGGQD